MEVKPYLEAQPLMVPLVIDDPKTKTVQEIVWEESKANLVDPRLPYAIMMAESGGRATATNPSSSATGLFQFVNGTWESFCVKKYGLGGTWEDKINPVTNTRCAIYILRDGGFDAAYGHWKSSYQWWKNWK